MLERGHVDRRLFQSFVSSHAPVTIKVVSSRRVFHTRKCGKDSRQLLRSDRRTRQNRRRACDEKIVEAHQGGYSSLHAKLGGFLTRLVRGRSRKTKNHAQAKARFGLAKEWRLRKGKLCGCIERVHHENHKQQIFSQGQVFRFEMGVESARCQLDSRYCVICLNANPQTSKFRRQHQR